MQRFPQMRSTPFGEQRACAASRSYEKALITMGGRVAAAYRDPYASGPEPTARPKVPLASSLPSEGASFMWLTR